MSLGSKGHHRPTPHVLSQGPGGRVLQALERKPVSSSVSSSGTPPASFPSFHEPFTEYYYSLACDLKACKHTVSLSLPP